MKYTNQAVNEFLVKKKFNFQGTDALVFITVRNEEDTISDVITKVKQSGKFDILVIDDQSTDETPAILRKQDIEVITRSTDSGSRIIDGLAVGYSLGYKYVIKIDGDLQHDPQDIPRLYQHAIITGADIVIGSRHLNGFCGNKWSVIDSGMWFCANLASVLSHKRITDATSGLKLWSRAACSSAIDAFQRGKLKQGSTFHYEELLIALRKGLKVEEISVVIHPRLYGESKSYAKKELLTFPLSLIRSTIRAYF